MGRISLLFGRYSMNIGYHSSYRSIYLWNSSKTGVLGRDVKQQIPADVGLLGRSLPIDD